MAIVVRYFSTSAAGAGDGTTWADRAAFISGGAFSTIITGFNFIGPDSLEVRLGPGSYSAPTDFSSSQFTSNQPRPEFPLVIHGCDSSGNRITPDVGWNCAEGPLVVTNFPVIDLSSTRVFNLANMTVRCICLTSSRGGSPITQQQAMSLDYVKLENTASNSSAACISSSGDFALISNCHFICSGTSFNAVFAGVGSVHNVRIEGNSSASSGNRRGIVHATSGFFSTARGPICIINCPGAGFINTITTSAGGGIVSNMTINNCGTGIEFSTGSGGGTTANGKAIIEGCFVTNCTTGIVTTNAASMIYHSRLRNTTNLSVPVNSLLASVVETSGSDSAEYVNASGGDYRIKSSSTYWGEGYGAGDEMTAGGTAKPTSPFNQQVIA